jgi:hypothetical protein
MWYKSKPVSQDLTDIIVKYDPQEILINVLTLFFYAFWVSEVQLEKRCLFIFQSDGDCLSQHFIILQAISKLLIAIFKVTTSILLLQFLKRLCPCSSEMLQHRQLHVTCPFHVTKTTRAVHSRELNEQIIFVVHLCISCGISSQSVPFLKPIVTRNRLQKHPPICTATSRVARD